SWSARASGRRSTPTSTRATTSRTSRTSRWLGGRALAQPAEPTKKTVRASHAGCRAGGGPDQKETPMSTWKRAAVAGALLLATLATAANAEIPNPTVSGPIAATAPPGDPSRNYPFSATNQDLAQWGYVEEEFFIEGTANRYNTPSQATGSVIDG